MHRAATSTWRFALVCAALALPAWVRPSPGQAGPLPDGPGKEETQKICAQCHTVEQSIAVRLDRAGWQRTMDKMAALGAQGTAKEFAAIVEYLAKNFPADEVPKINVNKAKAIELESGLSLRRSEAAALVGYRAKNGGFKSIEDLKKVPGVDAAKIEAKKDRLVF